VNAITLLQVLVVVGVRGRAVGDSLVELDGRREPLRVDALDRCDVLDALQAVARVHARVLGQQLVQRRQAPSELRQP